MLATLASPTLSLAAAHDELASAPRNAKCADRDGQGTEIVEVDALFKCFGDDNGFDGALSGLAGALASHTKRAYGIVTFREGSYFARVEAPFKVSSPAFYKSEDTYYACVTVQNGVNADEDEQDATPDYWTGHTATSSVNAAPAIPESRLLAATLDADVDDADDDAAAQSGDAAKAEADDEALPLQSRNPGGLRPPKAPPKGNTPAAMPEYQSKQAGEASDKQ